MFLVADVEAATTDLGQLIHEVIAKQAQEDALKREGQTFTWLREHWPWYLRWAIGYPRAIAALDRLGLVVLPVFVAGQVVEVPEQLKSSTTGCWTIQVYGRDVQLHASAWAGIYVKSAEGEYRSVDVPLTPGAFSGHPCLLIDPGPIAEAINELELDGAMIREDQFLRRQEDEDDNVCQRCGNEAEDRTYGGCEHCREDEPEETT